MDKQLELTAAVYEGEEQASRILDGLQRMHRGSTITLADLAMVTKESDGKVHIKETREVSGLKGATRGAVVTGIFGVIYPPSLLVTAAGGAIAGGLWGRLRDSGIKTGQLKEFGDALTPGKAAVVALSEAQHVPEIEAVMDEWNATMIHHSFDGRDTKELDKAAHAGDRSA
jgi:uncharacterized membrane protein